MFPLLLGEGRSLLQNEGKLVFKALLLAGIHCEAVGTRLGAVLQSVADLLIFGGFPVGWNVCGLGLSRSQIGRDAEEGETLDRNEKNKPRQ